MNYYLHMKQKQDTCLMWHANILTLTRHFSIPGFLKGIPGGSSSTFTFTESGCPALGMVANVVGLFGFRLRSCPHQSQILRWPWAEKRTKGNCGLGKEQRVTGRGPCRGDGDNTEVFRGLCISTGPVQSARAGFPNP